MKLLRVVLFGLVCLGFKISSSQADLIINSAYSEATATLATEGNVSDSTMFKSSSFAVNNNIIGWSRSISLGDNNSGGQGNYSYSVGNSVTNVVPLNMWNLEVNTQAIYNVASNQATLGESFEKFKAVLEFTITNQNYEGAVQLYSLLTGPASASLGSQNVYGTLSSDSGGVLYEMNRTRSNLGVTSFNSTFPNQILLTPDTYRLEVTLSGMRDVPYNGHFSGFGGISISASPAAVPEPGSMAVLACAGVLGGRRLIRWRKRQQLVV